VLTDRLYFMSRTVFQSPGIAEIVDIIIWVDGKSRPGLILIGHDRRLSYVVETENISADASVKYSLYI